MIDLIWTYSTKLKRPPVRYPVSSTDIQLLYRDSMKFPYSKGDKVLYTDLEGAKIFQGYVDKIILLPSNFEFYFLDDIKFYVIENHSIPHILIDGDLILENLILDENCSFGAEKPLTYRNSYYEYHNSVLEKEDISKVIPYWKGNLDSFNIGLIYIGPDFPRSEFIEVYRKVKNFYKEKIEPKYKFIKKGYCIEMSTCTYLLNLFVKHKKISYFYFSNSSKFKHYSGTKLKFEYCNALTSKSII